jgi:hypothetical protein
MTDNRVVDVASGLALGTAAPFAALGIARLFRRDRVPLWVAGLSGGVGYLTGARLSSAFVPGRGGGAVP